jgi:hypothetical protein
VVVGGVGVRTVGSGPMSRLPVFLLDASITSNSMPSRINADHIELDHIGLDRSDRIGSETWLVLCDAFRVFCVL